MGLIRVAIDATRQVIQDQYLEFFECPSMPDDVLIVKGHKSTKGNTRNNNIDDVISNGSLIIVNKGQAMAIVDNGAVVEFTAEAGPFVFDSSAEPSIFSGSLGQNVVKTFKTIGRRISFGGHTGRTQQVYFFNTKLIKDNLFGTATPITFRAVDRNIGLDMDVHLSCHGSYNYQVVDPIMLFSNIAGNVEESYSRKDLDGTMKKEFIAAMRPSLAALSRLELRPSQVADHEPELAEELKKNLTQKWLEDRGIEIKEVNILSTEVPPDELKQISDLQKMATLRDPGLAAAKITEAQAEAMKTAAGNQGGAMMGFMGMNMAQMAGGMNNQSLYQMAGQQQQQYQQPAPQSAPVQGWSCACGASGNTGKFCRECGKPKPAPAESWTCACGTVNTGKFCLECGKPKPTAGEGWSCSCGAVNKGKFCMECGKPKPAGAPLYRCDKCGWEPADPKHPPKFCPQCGDPFDENDVQ